MEKKPKLHLFEGYGVELEYMIVDKETLNVKPIAEVLLTTPEGIVGELEHGITARSNELVSHVIELKSNGPATDLLALRQAFSENVRSINAQLAPHQAMLMPSAAHPWMNPATETHLWQHESQEIYHLYDRIFNCKGHGWSNLQSTHINLPFYDDEEFARLHTAIRFLLPVIPALTAASPVLDGKFTGYMDKRLFYYEKNQSKIPVITGKVIPEKVFTKHQYQKHIYDRIASAIAPFDPEGVLKPVWLNSRGAMARFDRGAIEIRIIDIQECPSADLSVVALLSHVLKLLVKGKWVPFDVQQAFETEDLHAIFRTCVKSASQAAITDPTYLAAWGLNQEVTGRQLWKHLIDTAAAHYPEEIKDWLPDVLSINENGTLAERIMESLEGRMNEDGLYHTYKTLAHCLQDDELFLP